jgi:FkbM family methyltransferase
MTLYNEWIEAEANIDIGDKMFNIKSPSKIALLGALGHLCPETNHLFMRHAAKSKPIKYVVDVGANMGGTTLLFNRAFPDARILAIEPVELNYKYLLHNTRGIANITTLKIAASSERALIRLSMPTTEQRPDLHRKFGNSGLYSIFGKDDEYSETVRADTLDNIVDDRVDFLKIDVEGAEALVLAGAKRIMTKDRPIVIIELRGQNIEMSGHTFQEYNSYFQTLDYVTVGSYRGDFIMCPAELKHFRWKMP